VTYHQIPYAMDQGISEPVSGKNNAAKQEEIVARRHRRIACRGAKSLASITVPPQIIAVYECRNASHAAIQEAA
jgi:hypothetical protein